MGESAWAGNVFSKMLTGEIAGVESVTTDQSNGIAKYSPCSLRRG